jgi:hypothetical protein
MKYHHPLKQILSQARPYWDRDGTRAAVRRAFDKALQRRTAELGGEVFASENQEFICYHTCKSRASQLWLPRRRTVAARAVGRTSGRDL